MKLLNLLLAGLFVVPVAFAQDLIILDEGYNTQQSLNIPVAQRGEQGCVSIETQRTSGANPELISGSFCNPRTSNFEFGPNAGEITNRIKYDFFDSNGAVVFSDTITVRKKINNLERGEHGNWVSNAAYDFDKTLKHRLWQVFGVKREGSNFRFSSRTQESGTPGDTIQVALDEIGVNAANPLFPTSFQNNLGAVVMSLGAAAGDLSDLKCGARDGQDSVNLLRERGIAVVVALQNKDVAPDTQTWPACLSGVILVAGESVTSQNGTNQAGIGNNGVITFFAKDTTPDSQSGTQTGNSFAAPRVAAAFAKLHELFPRSSVDQKTQALEDADDLMDTYRTRLANGTTRTFRARKLRPSHMANAISNLTLLQPPAPDPSTIDLNIADNSQYGTYYGQANQPYTVIFDLANPIANQSVSLGSTASRAGTRVLSSRRDIEVSFTGIFGNGFLNGFFLEVNGSSVNRFSDFFGNTPKDVKFVINRNLLNEGANQITIRSATNNPWGVSNILIKHLPVVPLTLGVNNPNVYGYEQNPTRFTGLRASFNVSNTVNTDYIMNVTGFDIDRSDETEVFVNGNFLGHLRTSESSAFSRPNRFRLRQDDLQAGVNMVEFVQRQPLAGVWEGSQDEKWAVKNIIVSEANDSGAVLVPVIQLLLDD